MGTHRPRAARFRGEAAMEEPAATEGSAEETAGGGALSGAQKEKVRGPGRDRAGPGAAGAAVQASAWCVVSCS